METVIIKTEGKKLQALLTVLGALEIPFKRTKSVNLDDRIKEAREEKRKGQLKIVNTDNLWESIS